MEFFRFLKKESPELDRWLIIAGVFAGIVSTLLILVLTLAGNRAARGARDFGDLVGFGLYLCAYWAAKGYLMQRVTEVVEEIIERVRLRLVDKIRNSDLAAIESMGRAPFYSIVSTHAMTLSRAATAIISGAVSLVLLSCAFLIIFLYSSVAFLVAVGTLLFIIAVFRINQGRVTAYLAEATETDNKFVHGFGDLLDGFKELKMSSAKSQEFLGDYLKPTTGTAKEARIRTASTVNRSVLIASSALYVLLAAVVFIVPVLSPGQATQIERIMTLVVFMFGPISEVVVVYTVYIEAVEAIREIERVERRLDALQPSSLEESVSDGDSPLVFGELQCTNITFDYIDEGGQTSFSLQPFEFHLSPGELVFVAGGNGSGKSTFLKVLAGLYLPASGNISVNNVQIGSRNRKSYRDLFSPVFSDFHLFDRVYGLKEIDETRLRDLLEMTELSHKTAVVDHRISTVNLSTGQRKRLALVLCILEDKPILLLDEWAAEQDPQFRRKFYREILPDLKQSRKAVVAVTHDDDHYDVADRVLKMQFGNFVPL
jgi:putative pyoverdin transport system ATP-binding/permease protein